jgi:hypothetical protein
MANERVGLGESVVVVKTATTTEKESDAPR